MNANLNFNLQLPNTNFDYQNCVRNAKLILNGMQPPKPMVTGTTIAAFVYKDGVILGADTRSCLGKTVVNQTTNKLHFLAENIYCGAAGISADAESLTNYTTAQLELFRLETERRVPVVSAVTAMKRALYQRRGLMAITLVIAGVDCAGSHVYTVYPHGSTDKLPYASGGSGLLPAMSIFESYWQPNMQEEAAKNLMRHAISAGITTDLSSGCNIDLCLLRSTGRVSVLRNVTIINQRGDKQINYNYAAGSTPVLKTHFEYLEEKH